MHKDLLLQSVTMALVVVLLLTLVSQCWSAPYRRNWTPQAILYLKGAQRHRSVLERSSRDNAGALSEVTYNKSRGELKTSSPASMFLQRLMEEGGDDPYEELNYLL